MGRGGARVGRGVLREAYWELVGSWRNEGVWRRRWQSVEGSLEPFLHHAVFPPEVEFEPCYCSIQTAEKIRWRREGSCQG